MNFKKYIKFLSKLSFSVRLDRGSEGAEWRDLSSLRQGFGGQAFAEFILSHSLRSIETNGPKFILSSTEGAYRRIDPNGFRKKYILAILLICTFSNTRAMPSITLNYNRYPTSVPMTPYYPATYVPVYYPYNTSPYYYWPAYSDYYYWPDDYYDSPAKKFLKLCAVMGVLALAVSIIEAILSH